MPRTYSMRNRSATVDDTRQRIVDATVALHNEKGITATSMQDIAARANVSLGTVYRHFPSLEELVPACGNRNLELAPPPTSEDFAGLESGEERVRALFAALYTHFDAAQRPYEVGFAEALTLPVVKDFMKNADAHIRSLVAEAVQPFNPTEQGVAFAVAMADFHAWQAFHRAGMDTATAAEMAANNVVAQLSRERSQPVGEN